VKPRLLLLVLLLAFLAVAGLAQSDATAPRDGGIATSIGSRPPDVPELPVIERAPVHDPAHVQRLSAFETSPALVHAPGVSSRCRQTSAQPVNLVFSPRSFPLLI